MALINCRECGREISDEALMCPHCGCPKEGYRIVNEDTHKVKISYGHRTSRLITALIIVVLSLMLLMYSNCPDRRAHEEATTELGTEIVKRLAMDNGGLLGAGIAEIFGERVVDLMVSQMLQVNNYALFSIGSLHLPNGESQVVTLGLFGKVIPLATADQIYERLNEKKDDSHKSENDDEDNQNNSNVIQIDGVKGE